MGLGELRSRFGTRWYQKATVAKSSSRSTNPSTLPVEVSSAGIHPACSMVTRSERVKRTGSAMCQRYIVPFWPRSASQPSSCVTPKYGYEPFCIPHAFRK